MNNKDVITALNRIQVGTFTEMNRLTDEASATCKMGENVVKVNVRLRSGMVDITNIESSLRIRILFDEAVVLATTVNENDVEVIHAISEFFEKAEDQYYEGLKDKSIEGYKLLCE